MIRERLNMDVRYSAVRKGIVESGEMIANNPEYAVAVGLLAKGTENCALYIPPKVEVKVEKPVEEVKEEVKPTPEPRRRNPKRRKAPDCSAA